VRRAMPPRRRVGGWTQRRPRAGTREPEGQKVEEPPAAIWADQRGTGPVRFGPIAEMGVQRGSGARGTVFVIGTGILSARGDEGEEPVPVQQRDVIVGTGLRMPAQEMIVVEADLSGRVVVADIVIVSLWQRDPDRAEDQDSDPQGSPAAPF
jgi:hypothetical protein